MEKVSCFYKTFPYNISPQPASLRLLALLIVWVPREPCQQETALTEWLFSRAARKNMWD